MIDYLLPQRAATVQSLGHPAAGVIGWFDTTTNSSGVPINASNAMTFSAVWCAVRVISETLATLPCVLYRRTSNDGRKRATEDPRYLLMHDEPHPLMSAVTFFEVMTAQMVLQGNCYARITRAQGNQIKRLEIRQPDKMHVDPYGEGLLYTCVDPKEEYTEKDVLHIAGLGGDGISGWSVIKYGQQSIGSGVAGDSYAASQLGNGATPKGILKFPTRLDTTAREKFRSDWNEQHQGAGKAGNIAILHGGMDYQAISMTNEDAQLLQTRQFSIREIARWFRLPPHMLADLADSSVRANIEQQAMEFVVYSMAPWLTRWQQSLNRRLLTEDERKAGMYFEFLLDALLRGDAQSRFAAYATGRQWGWLSANDIRRRENMNLIDGGDTYLQPSNMIPADSDMAKGEKPDPPAPPSFGPPAPPVQEDDEEDVPDTVREEQQRNLAQRLNAILDEGKSLHAAIMADGLTVEHAIRSANQSLDSNLNSLRSVQQEIRQDINAPRKAHVRGWEDGRLALVCACNDLLHSHVKCCQRVERAEVTKASKMVVRGKNFVDWLDKWYGEFEGLLAERISDVVRCYAKIAEPVAELASVMASEYCVLHRQQLLAAADGDPKLFPSRVQTIMQQWQQDVEQLELEERKHVA